MEDQRSGLRAISLTARDLIQLANLIANDESFKIPKSILEAVRNVIAGREICSQWHQSQKSPAGDAAAAAAAASDEGHAYLIRTLKDTHDILFEASKEREAASSTKRSQPKVKHKKQDKHHEIESKSDIFQNRFQPLPVHETAKGPFGDTVISLEPPRKANKLHVEAKEREAKATAASCLFPDLEALS